MRSLILTTLLLLASTVEAANHYVRSAATGTGSGDDWTNAYTSLPASLVRGDTYYIADGTHGAYTFDDAVDGTTVITIRKATASSHGTDTGWDWTYGDGEVTWGAVTFSTSYWVFDGVTGGGPLAWTTGHGFTFTSTAGTSITYVTLADGVSAITLRHASFVQTGNAEVTITGGHAIYDAGSLSASTFEYLHFDNLVGLPFLLRNGSGNIFQYNYSGNVCGQSMQDVNQHCEVMVIHDMDDVHFRWNLITESPSSGGFVKNSVQAADNIRIYGNVIGDGFPVQCNTGSCDGWRIYNNTFYSVTGGPAGGDGTRTNWLVYNNLIVDGTVAAAPATHDYNWWSQITSLSCYMNVAAHENLTARYPSDCDLSPETAEPFANRAALDFALSGALAGASGLDTCTLTDGCSSTLKYDVDWLGRTRGADGVWDRGALEYSATAPAAPTGVR